MNFLLFEPFAQVVTPCQPFTPAVPPFCSQKLENFLVEKIFQGLQQIGKMKMGGSASLKAIASSALATSGIKAKFGSKRAGGLLKQLSQQSS